MTDVDFLAGKAIKQNIMMLNAQKDNLTANKVDDSILLRIYTLLGDPADYTAYIASLQSALDTKIAALNADFTAL